MKPVINTLIVTFFILFFASCGESGMKPRNTRIAGPLGDYFEIVDRPYKAANDGTVYIELTRVKDGLPEPWVTENGKTVGWNDGEVEPNLSIEFFDKNGNIVGKSKTLDLKSDHFIDDQNNLQNLVDLSVGESSSINFDLESSDAVQFALSSTFEYHPMPEVIHLSPEDEAKYSKMIDEYERIINNFISYQKTEKSFHTGYYEEAMELEEKISDCISNTASNLEERFSKLERTFSNAALFGSKSDDDDDDDDDD